MSMCAPTVLRFLIEARRLCLIGAMPPKKKLKCSPAAKTQSIVSGEDTTMAATDVKDIHEFQFCLDKWIEAARSLRSDMPGQPSPRPPLKLSDSVPGQYDWPVCEGGTLKAIVQRAWLSPDRLVAASAKLARAAGLIQGDDPDEFLDEFCSVADARHLSF